MPRTKPDNTIVHRVELGSYERSSLKEWKDAQVLKTRIDSGITAAKAVAVGAIGAGTIYVGYQGYLLCREIAVKVYGVWDEAEKQLEDAKQVIINQYEEAVGPLSDAVGHQNELLKNFVRDGKAKLSFVRPIVQTFNPFNKGGYKYPWN